MAAEWTDEQRKEAVQLYLDGEPTSENSMDLVKEVAERLDKTVNGVRMILMKAEVYVKKTPAKDEKKEGKATTSRISKDDALKSLREAIEASGQEVDEDIIKRMTGKAAAYFTGIVTSLNG